VTAGLAELDACVLVVVVEAVGVMLELELELVEEEATTPIVVRIDGVPILL